MTIVGAKPVASVGLEGKRVETWLFDGVMTLETAESDSVALMGRTVDS